MEPNVVLGRIFKLVDLVKYFVELFKLIDLGVYLFYFDVTRYFCGDQIPFHLINLIMMSLYLPFEILNARIIKKVMK